MKFKNGSIVLGLILSHAAVNAAAPITSNDLVQLHGKGAVLEEPRPSQGLLPRITVVNNTGSLIILQAQTPPRGPNPKKEFELDYRIIGQGQEAKYFDVIRELGVKDAKEEGEKALDKARYWPIDYSDVWDHPNDELIVTINPAGWFGSDPFVIEKKFVPMAPGGHWAMGWFMMHGFQQLAKEQEKSKSGWISI